MATTNSSLLPSETMQHNIRINPVSLACDSGLERELRTPLNTEETEQLQQGLIGEYDKHTIFYDVFLKTQGNGDVDIIAIGPPLLNLRKHLLPIIVDIEQQQFQLKEKFSNKKLIVFSVTVPPSAINSAITSLQVKLSTANNHQFSLELDKPLVFSGASLITLQKDNRTDWIKDWANYYRSEFDIANVVVYDNNSEQQDALTEELAAANINVIHWNFPHGIALGSSNKFCQVGQLNHFKWRFGSESPIFNFDIDELLVCKDASIKSDILKGKLLRFNNYLVPHQNGLPDNYSFHHYNQRLVAARNTAYKYVTSGATKGILNVHYQQRSTPFPKSITPEYFLKGKVVDKKHAYFLHYNGITTNWKSHYFDKLNVNQSQSTTTDNHVKNSFKRIQKPKVFN